MRTPRLFVVSGPSGAGKGTILAQALKRCPDLCLTVSATTRKPRPGEVDGVNYYFLSKDEFMRRVEGHEFLEWANVHGNCYGTLISEVNNRMDEGKSLVLEIDVQGAINVKKRYEDAVLIFVEPPSLEVLEKRLRQRGTEDEASLELRLANASQEMAQDGMYDVRIVNDNLECAVDKMVDAIHSYEQI